MIALSVRQPWAWAILHVGKDVDNRPWTTRFRGRVLLHVSKTCTRAFYEDARAFIEDRETLDGTDCECRVPPLDELPRGVIIGCATITDCIDSEKDTDFSSPWFSGRYGLVLSNVVELPEPVPCKGQQGLFRVPATVSDAVLALARKVRSA